MEIIFIINEVYLKLGIRNRRDFNNQRLFFVTYRNVYP
jgi:hypothetical protein